MLTGRAQNDFITALEKKVMKKKPNLNTDNNKETGKEYMQALLFQTIDSLNNLEKLIESKDINLVFLALPLISRNKRNQIIDDLNKYKVIVKTLPSISEIVDGRITLSDIKDLNVDDLLNREEIKPDIELLNKNINSKIVVVTGAGGSIGSELCRQIIKLRPRNLLLLELNEFALYKIYEELQSFNKNLKIVSLLVDTKDQKKLETILINIKITLKTVIQRFVLL